MLFLQAQGQRIIKLCDFYYFDFYPAKLKCYISLICIMNIKFELLWRTLFLFSTGMRFSLMEQKIAIARLLREFKLEMCSSSVDEIETKVQGIYAPKHPVYLKVTPRD